MSSYSIGDTVTVNEDYQQNYSYQISCSEGTDFDNSFSPDLTPQQMLALGIFGGNYFRSPPDEFPKEWFNDVRFSSGDYADEKLNYFGVNASQPLSEWQRKGWIYPEDPHGWFLWYCRYFVGRRIEGEDLRQIGRWKNMKRHVSQVRKYCIPGDESCRPRQRQALLHWAYDSRTL